MAWFSVQMNAAIIVGVVSLSITLLMVLGGNHPHQ
jgi:hypothetical protein